MLPRICVHRFIMVQYTTEGTWYLWCTEYRYFHAYGRRPWGDAEIINQLSKQSVYWRFWPFNVLCVCFTAALTVESVPTTIVPTVIMSAGQLSTDRATTTQTITVTVPCLARLWVLALQPVRWPAGLMPPSLTLSHACVTPLHCPAPHAVTPTGMTGDGE